MPAGKLLKSSPFPRDVPVSVSTKPELLYNSSFRSLLLPVDIPFEESFHSFLHLELASSSLFNYTHSELQFIPTSTTYGPLISVLCSYHRKHAVYQVCRARCGRHSHSSRRRYHRHHHSYDEGIIITTLTTIDLTFITLTTKGLPSPPL